MEELEDCAAIIEEGRRFQEAQGFTQWTKAYPNRETVRGDILKERGYVLRDGERLAGYLCVDFGGEPAYEQIEGAWHTREPYGVIHRMAFFPEYRGRGLAQAAFSLAEELCRRRGVPSLRIDTGFSNERMQHVIEKYGFEKCGIIRYEGNGRWAYDKAVE